MLREELVYCPYIPEEYQCRSGVANTLNQVHRKSLATATMLATGVNCGIQNTHSLPRLLEADGNEFMLTNPDLVRTPKSLIRSWRTEALQESLVLLGNAAPNSVLTCESTAHDLRAATATERS
jgi:hypothetical protein